MPAEPPFVPRWTWRALRKDWRRRAGRARSHPLALVALVASLAAFAQTFRLLQNAAAAPLESGLQASVALVVACLLLGLAGVALDLPFTPRVRLRRAVAPELRAEPAGPPGAKAPALARPTRDDVLAAIAARSAPRAAPAPPSSEALGVQALAALCSLADAAKASKPALASAVA